MVGTGYTDKVKYSKADGQYELLTKEDLTKITKKAEKGFDLNEFIPRIEKLSSDKSPITYEDQCLISYIRHLCLLRKGELIIPEMYAWVKDNVIKTIHTQKAISISNEEGDTFRGFLDAVIETKDNGVTLFDLKTSADPVRDYPDGCADNSPQLSIYSQEVGVPKVAYLIFDKKIRKKEPRVRVRVVYGEVTDESLDSVFNDIDTNVKLIKENKFLRNHESCNKYGGCPYRGYCYNNKDMTGLVDLTVKKEYNDKGGNDEL
jgi:predicted lipoprotein with Yx(FWY)xxD motif